MKPAAAPAIGDLRDAPSGAGSRPNAAKGEATWTGARQALVRPPFFWILLGYFVLEYVRPFGIQRLRLQFVALTLLVIGWAFQVRRPWSRNLTLQTAFLALCLFSATYAQNWFYAYVAARTMFGNVVTALGVTWMMARRRDFVLGVWFWVLIMSYQAVHSIVYSGTGTGGFVGDSNDVALACCTALPFAIQGMARLRGWRRTASAALALLFTTAIVATGSRGGFVGLVALVVYGILVSPNRIRNLVITGAAAGLFYVSVPASYLDRVESIAEHKEFDTGDQRLFLWMTAWNMWLDNPVVGVGAGNFNTNAGRYQLRAATGRFSHPMYAERDWTWSAVHSLYFGVLSETGVVGSLLYAGIVVGHFARLRRLHKFVDEQRNASAELRRDTTLYGVGLSMSMVGFLGAGAFLASAYYPYAWLLSALAVAWDRAIRAEIGEQDPVEASG